MLRKTRATTKASLQENGTRKILVLIYRCMFVDPTASACVGRMRLNQNIAGTKILDKHDVAAIFLKRDHSFSAEANSCE